VSLVYLDHAATTPIDPGVLAAMNEFLCAGPGNASAIHQAGVRVARGVEKARLIIARRLRAQPDEIIFTSGGTESNNLAIKGLALAAAQRGRRLVSSQVEHPSSERCLRWLQEQGFQVTRLPVDRHGGVDPDELAHALRPDTILVTLLHGNNELGTVLDLAPIASACHQARVPLHLDACQSFCKLPLAVGPGIDAISLNAHKLHGPTGVGALWLRRGMQIEALLHGGGQEAGLRSGTTNAAGIVGFGKAVRLATPERAAELAQRRAQLIAGLRSRLPEVIINGPRAAALPHVLSITLPGVDGKALFMELNRRGFMLSAGSACSASSTAPSPVLLAIGLSAEQARASLRISLGRQTTPDELDQLIDHLVSLTQPSGAAP